MAGSAMSERDEFYRRFSKSYDKLHQSEKQDDLVERVARAACASVNGDEAWDETGTDVQEKVWHTIARAAIAVALEEAAKVADAYEPRCDVCPRGVAAAIRAMIK